MTSHGREGILLFSDGEVIHARLGGLVGEQAVHELLTWTSLPGAGSMDMLRIEHLNETGAVPLVE